MDNTWLIGEELKSAFLQACENAENGKWDEFKKHPAVNCIIENSTQVWADSVRAGTGILYENMTPNEVRYAYTWLILTTLIPYRRYGKISEIGGGYGGMYESIAKSLYLVCPIRYYLFDLPEVSKLQRMYIDSNVDDFCNENAHCYSSFLPDMPSHDICIAWCSWSELDKETKTAYIDRLMVYADHIFISSNWDYDGDIELLRKRFPDLKEYTNPYLGKIIYT